MIPCGSLIPAYGRDYDNATDALRDWNEGNDFHLTGPGGAGYFSRSEADEQCPIGHTFQLRYYRRELVCVVTRTEDGWVTNHDAECREEDAAYVKSRGYRIKKPAANRN